MNVTEIEELVDTMEGLVHSDDRNDRLRLMAYTPVMMRHLRSILYEYKALTAQVNDLNREREGFGCDGLVRVSFSDFDPGIIHVIEKYGPLRQGEILDKLTMETTDSSGLWNAWRIHQNSAYVAKTLSNRLQTLRVDGKLSHESASRSNRRSGWDVNRCKSEPKNSNHYTTHPTSSSSITYP